MRPPDLSLTDNTSAVVMYPGRSVIYTLSYNNTGLRQANGVVITETLPPNTTWDSTDSSAGWSQVGTSDQYTYTVGTLPLNSPAQITFAVTLADPQPQGTTSLTDSATIADDGTNGADPTPTDNSASKTIPVSTAPELSLVVTAESIIQPGGVIHNILQYANNGYQAATGVVINETLPANTTFDSADSTSGWQLVSGAQYQFTVGQVAVGAKSSIVFAVTVATSLPQGVTSISNTASISDDGSHGTDPILSNNSSSASTLITSGPTNVCGTISTNTTWTADQSPYKVTCNITVNPGVTLTLGPGTIIKPVSSSISLIINGALISLGTVSSPVYFTSLKDDSVGGDTNGDGSATSPAKGDWGNITVNSGGIINLDHTMVEYSGGSGTIYASGNVQATIQSSTIAYGSGNGISLSSSSSTVTQLTLADSMVAGNAYTGISSSGSSGSSNITITGSSITNNGTNGISIGVSNSGTNMNSGMMITN